VKRNYHTLDNQGKTEERRLAQFLTKNGQPLLPMVELIAQSRIAIDDWVDTVGRATMEAVLRLSAEQVAGHRSRVGHARAKSSGREPRPAAFIGKSENGKSASRGCGTRR
jgi:hypothetical protein